jgi:hypothetical protein
MNTHTADRRLMYSWWTRFFGMTFINWVLKRFGRVKCDRCKHYVKGFLPTGGEYSVSGGVYVGWQGFMNEDEWIICDSCMHKDSRYTIVYPQPSINY